jgi:hypothetical protein
VSPAELVAGLRASAAAHYAEAERVRAMYGELRGAAEAIAQNLIGYEQGLAYAYGNAADAVEINLVTPLDTATGSC